jgi:hypothetical protein
MVGDLKYVLHLAGQVFTIASFVVKPLCILA